MIKVIIDKSSYCCPILSTKSAYIFCPYNPDIVDYLRNLQYRHYDAENKTWEIRESDLKDFCVKFGVSQWGPIDIKNNYKDESAEITYKETMPADYKPLLPLYQHQIDGINFGLNRNRFLLADDMGLGKSLQALCIADIKCKTGKVLVIVCSATLKYNWKIEIKKTLGQDSRILGTRQKYRKKWDDTITVEGNGQDKLDDLLNLDEIPEKFIITNRETLLANKKKKGRGYTYPVAEQINKLCSEGKIEAILVDEFHLGLRSVKGQASKALLKITEAEIKIAMTGTPVLNSPLDVYVIMRWLDIIPDTYSFWEFKDTFANLDHWGNPISYKNLPQLSAILRKNMLRRERKDCLDLPDKIYIDEYIEMDDKQKNLYNVIRRGLHEEMNKMIYSPEPLSRLIELRKVTGLPDEVDKSVKENPKLTRLKELVTEMSESGQKVVIYSNWTTVTRKIKEELKEFNPAYITGETATDKRMDEVNKLQTDSTCKVLIGTSAMGQGLTMTAATNFIFYDEPWNKGTYEQLCDRIYRIGQTQKVNIYNLICKDSIDEGIHQLINCKGEMARYIVDGQIDKTSHKNLLQALLSFGTQRLSI